MNAPATYLSRAAKAVIGERLTPGPETRAKLEGRLAETKGRIAELEHDRDDLVVEAADDPGAYARLEAVVSELSKLRDTQDGLTAGLRRLGEMEEQERQRQLAAQRRQQADAVQLLLAESTSAAENFTAHFAQCMEAYKQLIRSRKKIMDVWPAGAPKPEGLIVHAHEVVQSIANETARLGGSVHRLGGTESPEIPSFPGIRVPAVYLQRPQELPNLTTEIAKANAELTRILAA